MSCQREAQRSLCCGRNLELANKAAAEIREDTKNEVVVKKLDLASLQSVRDCAKELEESEEKIDYLINNAGVMTCPEWKTEDGYEMQFGTNHLGHFLLTNLLTPLLQKSGFNRHNARVVIVSSLAHQYGRCFGLTLIFLCRIVQSKESILTVKISQRSSWG